MATPQEVLIILAKTGLPDVDENSDLANDSRFDSVKLITFILLIEEAFGIRLDLKGFEKKQFRNVIAIAEAINQQS
ncbi:acyl carrier protein [Parendozoicomonas haliclonae]|uniref:Carrier domain-containing protein n=1 Tax=Parendozoicomonas haliclonae TaxID=1960125 RepID=A0A1X7AGB8_9GAMM|nr:phosphopantetheine-binding protein [Parendozoicomonas haliclonae]SMA38232.1 hypothetical protein EHSB41UT_00857 [Parendozoicomonas haliclonae]